MTRQSWFVKTAALAPWAGGRGFDPRPRHTKDVINKVPDASLLSAQHIRTGLASLSSQTSFKKEMDTIWRVINISWDNFFRNQPHAIHRWWRQYVIITSLLDRRIPPYLGVLFFRKYSSRRIDDFGKLPLIYSLRV